MQGYKALLLLTDWLSYLMLAMMAVVVTVDVFCRYALGFSTQLAEEAASLGLVVLMFIALPGVFEENGFLRVDVFYGRLTGRIKQAFDFVFHLLALSVTAVYVFQLFWLARNSFQTGIKSDGVLATPNFLPQAAMVFGMCALGVALFAGLMQVIAQRRKGELNND